MGQYSLEPHALIFALHEGDDCTFSSYKGEIRCDLDSDETAFILPCNRIEMTNEVCDLIREKLEPLGIRYMRWWNNGRLEGRSFDNAF